MISTGYSSTLFETKGYLVNLWKILHSLCKPRVSINEVKPRDVAWFRVQNVIQIYAHKVAVLWMTLYCSTVHGPNNYKDTKP